VALVAIEPAGKTTISDLRISSGWWTRLAFFFRKKKMNDPVGWCYKNKEGVLNLETLSPTKLGTQVNYLYSPVNMIVLQSWEDSFIAEMVEDCLKQDGGLIVQVRVSECPLS